VPRLSQISARLSTVLVALALVACAAPAPTLLMRDPAVPVRSLAAFDLGRLAGDWTEVAHLAAPDTGPCAPGRLTVRSDGAALRLDGALCLGGVRRPISARAVAVGPGRLAVSGFAEDWWLIWADDGARTAVLAAPSGAFAVVLDRGRIGPDRLAAAREVLAFNGFAVSALR
jgi:apolipoprotein D and lipocalin family protein